MKKKSHEGPDAQGPWLSSAQLRGRNLQSWATHLYILYSWGKGSGTRRGIYNSQGAKQRDAEKMLKQGMCLKFPLPVPGIQALMREAFTALKSLLATSVAACVWITCLLC